MKQKIRYRLVYNRKHRLNRNGQALVQIECLLNQQRTYFSTKIYLRPEDWDGSYVVGHPLAKEFNQYLFDQLIKLQKIEFEFIRRGKTPSLRMLKNAVLNHVTSSARFSDFVRTVNEHAATRSAHTRDAYNTLIKIVDSFQNGTTLEDIDIDWLNRFVDWQKGKGLSQSTIAGRLKSIRCIINEAIARKLMSSDDDPFRHFRIPKIRNREETLSFDEVKRLIRLNLIGREKHIRDAFVFDCMCGLRYSDLTSLGESSIQTINGKKWVVLTTKKTGDRASVPIQNIFHGVGYDILKSYPSIEEFANVGNNASANRTLKEIFTKARIDKYAHFHLARHTFITLCIEEGIPITTVQLMAAHSKIETTRGYAKLGVSSIEKDVGRAFVKKSQRRYACVTKT